ncbi:hypothetical protein [Streptomyces longispororuber]|uniref:hypothetical protein n=1 Tax=Streptomyces longispororuber TaxID=68230 RepID=UPI0036FFAB3C
MRCGRAARRAWRGRGGSWINDQIRNLESRRARMYNPSGAMIYKTPTAYSFDAHGDWNPVRYVIPCG